MNTTNLAQLLQGRTLSKPSSGNQRAYADLLEELACATAQAEYPTQYRKARSVRSPEDFTLVNGDCNNYFDVKTRQVGTDFNMPNLISVDRLDKMLEDPDTELHYWMIDYRVHEDGTCTVEHSEIRTVWSLPWPALAIQNLGKGQLQISNWSQLATHVNNRDAWHQFLKAERKRFYLKQASKFQRMADAIK
jgi:hypothetical protein